jgi:chromosomal replication initiator protein
VIKPHGRITGQQVIAAVADDAGLYVGVLIGQSRIRPVARPRQVAAYLMRRLCLHLSRPAIGRLLGNRDHTTIIHAERKIALLMTVDSVLAAQVERIETQLVEAARGPKYVPDIPFHVLCAGYAASMRRAAA